MGKKPRRHDWPEAKKLCRLNQDEIAMAKKLGFNPDSLIRSRPDPKQKWKLPVKYWIRELHLKRFGNILGEKLEPAPPATDEYVEEHWEPIHDTPPPKRSPTKAGPYNSAQACGAGDERWLVEDIDNDRDLPF